MKVPKYIFVHKNLEKELKKKWLWTRFEKAKNMILMWNVSSGVKFALMEPKQKQIWYFRINRQFRVLGEFDEDGNLYLTVLDDHQNM